MTRRRYELTDKEWLIIEPSLPNKPRGVPRVDDRRVLNGILWRFRSGRPGQRSRSAMGRQQPVRPLAKGRCMGPAAGGGIRRLQR
jgi:transposase